MCRCRESALCRRSSRATPRGEDTRPSLACSPPATRRMWRPCAASAPAVAAAMGVQAGRPSPCAVPVARLIRPRLRIRRTRRRRVEAPRRVQSDSFRTSPAHRIRAKQRLSLVHASAFPSCDARRTTASPRAGAHDGPRRRKTDGSDLHPQGGAPGARATYKCAVDREARRGTCGGSVLRRAGGVGA